MLSRGWPNVASAQAMDISPDVFSISLESNVSESVRLGRFSALAASATQGAFLPAA